ncbi:hypothetical protein ABB07_12480, partial [Streptomyces incarnatus]
MAILAGLALPAIAPSQAWAAPGPNAYVTNYGDNSVSMIDTATNSIVGSPIPVGANPFDVAITPDGKHAYVTNQNASGTVS